MKTGLLARLPPDNLWRTALPWSRFGLDPGLIKHHIYLRGFGLAAERQLKRLIEAELLSRHRFSASGDTEFCEEVLVHLHRCRAQLDSFVGRDSMLQELQSRLERRWRNENWREDEEEEEDGDAKSVRFPDNGSNPEEVRETFLLLDCSQSC